MNEGLERLLRRITAHREWVGADLLGAVQCGADHTRAVAMSIIREGRMRCPDCGAEV